MPNKYEKKINDMGLALPDAPTPAGNYVPFVVAGDMVYISGQISADSNGLITGKLGDDLDVDQGKAAAKTCALNLIAQLKAATDGNLDRLVQVVKLVGFVNSTDSFNDHPQVINGASDFMAEVFGEAGRHARAAVGCSSLPRGVAVEVEGVFQIK